MIDPAKIRKDFPILSRRVRGKPLVYLDNAATTQKPRAVIESLVSFYERHNANVHRGVHELSEEATNLVETTRAKVASLIGARHAHCVIFTRNTTESINLVAHAWGRKFLKEGDEILLTEIEHHSNLVPWQMIAQEKGVKLRFIPVAHDGTLDVDSARRLLSPRTKLIAFSALSNALGSVSPIEKILAMARSIGATTLIDAAQWAPHRPIDVRAWGCDFLAFSAHKMLGPTGIGVLYGKEDILEAMDPFLGGGDMIRQVFLDHSTYNVLPYKFEAGTPNIADAAAFDAAIDYLQGVGFDEIERHERALLGRALSVLGSMSEVEMYGPKDLDRQACLVSFNIAGLHPHDASTAIDLEGIAVRAGHHCCQPLMAKLKIPGTVRASFYLYNTLEEVDRLAVAVSKAARFFKKEEAIA